MHIEQLKEIPFTSEECKQDKEACQLLVCAYPHFTWVFIGSYWPFKITGLTHTHTHTSIKSHTPKITWPWAPWIIGRPFQSSGSGGGIHVLQWVPVEPDVFCLFRYQVPILLPEINFLPFHLAFVSMQAAQAHTYLCCQIQWQIKRNENRCVEWNSRTSQRMQRVAGQVWEDAPGLPILAEHTFHRGWVSHLFPMDTSALSIAPTLGDSHLWFSTRITAFLHCLCK